MRLETERLIMRPFQPSDLVSFAAYRSDPEVARYQGWDAPYSIEASVISFSPLLQPAVKTAPTSTKSAFADSFPVHEGGLCSCCREFIRWVRKWRKLRDTNN